MKYLYKTFYSPSTPERPDGSYFSSYVYARDIKELQKLIAKRNIGERFDCVVVFGETLPGKLSSFDNLFGPENSRFFENFHLILHQAIFIGYLLLASGRTGLNEVLGDLGFVHSLAHLYLEKNVWGLSSEQHFQQNIEKVKQTLIKAQKRLTEMSPENEQNV